MIVDASALVAVLFKEAAARAVLAVLIEADGPLVPASAWVEAGIAAQRLGPVGPARLQALADQVGVQIAPLTADHARAAVRAWELYGRGSGHPARLNFGDCLVYATAALADEPLLFVGDGFAQTDLRPAHR